MGIAQYNRGSRAISAQIDQEQQGKPSRMIDYLAYAKAMDHAKRLQERISVLENELEKSRRGLASSRAMLAVERDNRAEERALLDARVKEHFAAAERYRRSWEKASAMIRECLTPEQVQQYREDRDWMGGK